MPLNNPYSRLENILTEFCIKCLGVEQEPRTYKTGCRNMFKPQLIKIYPKSLEMHQNTVHIKVNNTWAYL